MRASTNAIQMSLDSREEVDEEDGPVDGNVGRSGERETERDERGPSGLEPELEL